MFIICEKNVFYILFAINFAVLSLNCVTQNHQSKANLSLERRLAMFDFIPENQLNDPAFKALLQRRLLGSWEQIRVEIPKVEQSYKSLISVTKPSLKQAVDYFKESSSVLLQAYSFFFYSLQDKDFSLKYNKIVALAVSHQSSESVGHMVQIYKEIESLNKKWQLAFPTKASVLTKWPLVVQDKD